MKKSKKIISVVLTLLMIISALPFSAAAANTASDIKSVKAEDFSIEEGTHGSFSRDVLEADESGNATSYGPWYYYYHELEPESFIVEYKDGSTEVMGADAFKTLLGVGYISSDALQSYENQMTAGNTYDVNFSAGGFSMSCKVTLTPSRIKSLTVEDTTVDEDLDAKLYSIYEESGEKSYYNYTPNPQITITYSDNTVFTGNLYECREREPDISMQMEQNYDNQWAVGNTYPCNIFLGACAASFNCTVAKSKIASIKVDNMTLIPGKDGYVTTDHIYTNGQWVDTDPYFVYTVSPKVTLVYTDNTEESFSTIYKLSELGYYTEISGEDQSYNNQLREESTYTYTLTVGTKKCTFDVAIAKDPISGIEVKDFDVIDGINGYYTTTSTYDPTTGSYVQSPDFFAYFAEAEELTVHFSDGTSFTGTPSEISAKTGFYPRIEARQTYDTRWSVGNTYTVKVILGTKTTTYNVRVVENPIASIEIADFSNPEFVNGRYSKYYYDDATSSWIDRETFEYYAEPDSIKINYKDGHSDTVTVEKLFSGYLGSIGGNVGVYADTRTWTAGNTYPVKFKIGDVSTTYNVTITSRSAESAVWAYNDCENGIDLTAYRGSAAEVTVPAILDGKKVDALDETFYENATLKKVTLQNGIATIAPYAFYGCSALESVVIPDSVTSIQYSAFMDCKNLKSITVPASVKSITDYALGFTEDENNDNIKVEGFVIYGKNNTAAEAYAKKWGFDFVSTGNTPALTFPDVSANEWYYNAVAFNVNMGYFHGYGNGYFGPGNNIQRQDFVVVLSKIAGVDLSDYAGQNGGFSDVPTNDYYSAAVAWAKDNHILSGYANGKFGVGDPITREQACLIFYNYCNGEVSGNVNTVLAGYPDGGNVSDWARTAVAWAAENHVVGGNGKLNPAGNANRAEMAQIIMNMSLNGIL